MNRAAAEFQQRTGHPLADRALLQSAQTASAGENLCRHLRQRVAYSDLDGPDRAPAAEGSKLKARFGWSLSNLVALRRMNLFVYRDLWAWLDEPFTAAPVPAGPVQPAFRFP